ASNGLRFALELRLAPRARAGRARGRLFTRHGLKNRRVASAHPEASRPDGHHSEAATIWRTTCLLDSLTGTRPSSRTTRPQLACTSAASYALRRRSERSPTQVARSSRPAPRAARRDLR